MAQRCLREQGYRPFDVERRNIVDALDQVHGVGGDGHRSDRLVVAIVADVDDVESLAGTHSCLVMDLGHERTHCIHDEAAVGLGGRHDFGRGTMRAEHQGSTNGHVGEAVDEDDAEVAEAVDDETVVDDLVVAVDGRLEHPDEPGESLDGHLDSGAESPRCGKEHLIDAAGATSLIDRDAGRRWRGVHPIEGIGVSGVRRPQVPVRPTPGPPGRDRGHGWGVPT